MVRIFELLKNKPIVVETRQCLVSTILIVFLGLFVGCNDDGDPGPPVDPPVTFTYFESVGDSKQYTSDELIAGLAGEAGVSLPSVFPDIDVKVEVIYYHTIDPQGKPVVASGLISYPASETIKDVVLAEHYTISADYEAPSSQMKMIESALALYGYIVITPDYLGFGSTKELRHPYLHVENTAQVSLDMLFAVREYMESKEAPLQKGIYITGYSQGGAAALAVQQMAEAEYTSEINVKRVIAGGGPYDLTAIFDEVSETGVTSYPCAVPMIIIGMDYGDNLKLDYTQVFTGNLLANYDEWINSKKYTTDEINRELGSNIVSNYIHPDFFKAGTNSELSKLYASLAKNSLINWTPKAPLVLIHGQSDDVVPYFCAQHAYDSFKEKGSKVELIPANSGHKETAITYYLYLLRNLM